jgi:hypothetical protein
MHHLCYTLVEPGALCVRHNSALDVIGEGSS